MVRRQLVSPFPVVFVLLRNRKNQLPDSLRCACVETNCGAVDNCRLRTETDDVGSSVVGADVFKPRSVAPGPPSVVHKGTVGGDGESMFSLALPAFCTTPKPPTAAVPLTSVIGEFPKLSPPGPTKRLREEACVPTSVGQGQAGGGELEALRQRFFEKDHPGLLDPLEAPVDSDDDDSLVAAGDDASAPKTTLITVQFPPVVSLTLRQIEDILNSLDITIATDPEEHGARPLVLRVIAWQLQHLSLGPLLYPTAVAATKVVPATAGRSRQRLSLYEQVQNPGWRARTRITHVKNKIHTADLPVRSADGTPLRWEDVFPLNVLHGARLPVPFLASAACSLPSSVADTLTKPLPYVFGGPAAPDHGNVHPPFTLWAIYAALAGHAQFVRAEYVRDRFLPVVRPAGSRHSVHSSGSRAVKSPKAMVLPTGKSVRSFFGRPK